MFPSRAFKGIACPLGSFCELFECSFDHVTSTQAQPNQSLPQKRSRLQSELKTHKKQANASHHLTSDGDSANNGQVTQSDADSKKGGIPRELKASGSQLLSKSITRPDQPQNKKLDTASKGGSLSRKNSDAASPVPMMVNGKALVDFSERTRFTNILANELMKAKVETPNNCATKLEAKILKATTSRIVYINEVKKMILKLKKGDFKLEEEEGSEVANANTNDRANSTAIDDPSRRIELVASLKNLVLSPAQLSLKGYVVSPIEPRVEKSSGLVECDRCKTLYFRNKKSSVVCRFHPKRPIYDHELKKRSTTYPCCGDTVGRSKGCTTASRHVFKFTDHRDLASVINYTHTVEPTEGVSLLAAGLDCEMGYTEQGFELIRVTIVDWVTKKTVLDRTVFPKGEVLDFNTCFSGISTLDEGCRQADGTIEPTITFEESDALIKRLISKDTILIGHGLQSDLNCLRLIHTNVVDTAMLYPTSMLAYPYSLKALTFKYLGRNIQIGEHDSMEDALAAMDIVECNIANK